MPCSNIPFRRDVDFVDCGIINKIDSRCGGPAARVALVGLGGVGKSQTAIEYSYRIRIKSPQAWVFWVHGGTRARFEEGYRRIIDTVKMNGWDNPQTDVLRLVRGWLSDESSRPWTLILDNCDDGGVFFPAVQTNKNDASEEPLSNFIPQAPWGSILVTSRSRDVAHRITGSHADIIMLDPMSEAHALTLLGNRLQITPDQKDASELVEALDYMPLAISQAAAYINQRSPRVTIERYLETLREGDRAQSRLLDSDVGDIRRDGTASNSILATWQISFEYIRSVKPSAARLLSLMSFFDRQGIPENLLSGHYNLERDCTATTDQCACGSLSDAHEHVVSLDGNGESNDDELNFEDDLSLLISFCFIATDFEDSLFKMHRLVQFATRKWLELNQELEQWKYKYMTILHAVHPNSTGLEDWPTCQSLLPHAQQAALLSQPTNREAAIVWSNVIVYAAAYAKSQGQYNTAQQLHSVAAEARKTIFGEDHRHAILDLAHTASILDCLGDYEEAHVLFQKSIDASRRVFGEEHIDTLWMIGHMVVVLYHQGQIHEAYELEAQLVEMRRRVLGPEHLDTLASMNSLAVLLTILERHKEGEEIYLQVLESRTKLLGLEHQVTINAMSNLAVNYSAQMRYQEAEELSLQSLGICRRLLGEEHPDTLIKMLNLASLYTDIGRFQEGERIGLKVLEVRTRLLSIEHPDTLLCLHNLGLISWNCGHTEDAISRMMKCFQFEHRFLGPDHPRTQLSFSYWTKWKMKVFGEENGEALQHS
ncbi:TPR-like protein [Amniculicola lignicola CBS 123094]|uniref:TPR-like protein n=1 Tax=Amniculicola lignicola CBS 123094 TaxID=1392246 RepID=A0A6A5W5F9_9PLEO|nr:TPR-like protein [Amniculicola lignicola CBS 123094]